MSESERTPYQVFNKKTRRVCGGPYECFSPDQAIGFYVNVIIKKAWCMNDFYAEPVVEPPRPVAVGTCPNCNYRDPQFRYGVKCPNCDYEND